MLRIVEFDSVRKMMTVVVKDDKGKIIVFTKGADTSVEPLLTNADDRDKQTMLHLNEFAC